MQCTMVDQLEKFLEYTFYPIQLDINLQRLVNSICALDSTKKQGI